MYVEVIFFDFSFKKKKLYFAPEIYVFSLLVYVAFAGIVGLITQVWGNLKSSPFRKWWLGINFGNAWLLLGLKELFGCACKRGKRMEHKCFAGLAKSILYKLNVVTIVLLRNMRFGQKSMHVVNHHFSAACCCRRRNLRFLATHID